MNHHMNFVDKVESQERTILIVLFFFVLALLLMIFGFSHSMILS
jgi:hypothetical protein